jgi:hypothetical protein
MPIDVTNLNIIWTALPNGLSGSGKAQLSVLVSPRLLQGGKTLTLGAFGDFKNWPVIVNGLEFDAYFNGISKPYPMQKLFNLDLLLWPRIFPETTPVRPFHFNDLYAKTVKDKKLISFNVHNALAYLKDKYVKVARQSPGMLPGIADRLNTGSVFQQLVNDLGQTKAIDLFQSVLDFYNRTTIDYLKPSSLDRSAAKVPPPPQVHEFDFHEALAMLADYPALMGKLGLALHFTLSLPQGAKAVRVAPRRTSLQDISPFTYFDNKFLPAPRRNDDFLNGFLNLSQAGEIKDEIDVNKVPYSLTQIDPDGAILKLAYFSQSLRQLPSVTPDPFGMDPDAGLPALRSGGLGLIRNGRAKQMESLLKLFSDRDVMLTGTRPNQGQSIFFNAEDLLRGYRVDVEESDESHQVVGRHSLCWRRGKLYFRQGPPVPLNRDEGYVRAASATSQEHEPNSLYLHESLFRWNGWSLCAERPNQTIVSDTKKVIDPVTKQEVVAQGESAGRPISQPTGPIDLEPIMEVDPGSLPRLRFGHSYRLRVRAVDLAGNSLLANNTDWNNASNSVPYLRFEPVAPPVLVLQDDLTRGESIERMVIRSNYDSPTKDENQRHLVPPKTSQEMAELHGMFDGYIGPNKDTAVYQKGFNIASREAGTLADKQIVDIDTGIMKRVQYADLIHVIKEPQSQENQLVIHGGESITLPYLPDPLAAGVVFRDLPSLDDPNSLSGMLEPDPGDLSKKILTVSFDQKWPEASSFRLRLVERDEQNKNQKYRQWDGRILTMFLSKGEKVTLRYNSYLPKVSNQLMAILHWLDLENIPSPEHDKINSYISAGCFWMITPYRKLELVHAVQQPVVPPSLDGNDKTNAFTAVKSQIGDTAVTFQGAATLHTWSTGKIELYGEWKDWEDSEKNDEAVQLDKQSFASQGLVPYEDRPITNVNLKFIKPNLRHELGDTHHRWVDYHLVGTSRYQEYFTDDKAHPLDFTRPGPVVHHINIPNSARPAAPQVEYILPTFGWPAEKKEGNSSTRVRLGGGLRVYMKRPWYSSGDDELLGVILAQPSDEKLNGHFLPYVTQFGLDPIWNSASGLKPIAPLSYEDFNNSCTHKEGLTLEELDGIQDSDPGWTKIPHSVNVVGFKPEYNNDRKLWFCDIQVNPNRLTSYFPFVRLALARFQPDSIADAHLSRVVMSEFVQLVPTRELQFTTNTKGNLKLVDLQLKGIAPNNGVGNQFETTNVVRVTVESHDDTIPGDLGWKVLNQKLLTLDAKPVLTPTFLDGKPALVLTEWVWKGTITLPITNTSSRYRLVVKETETFVSDGPFDKSIQGITDIDAERVVYADVIEL